MASIFDELFRIRKLREDKRRRALAEAVARASSCEQALAQVSNELRRFVAEMSGRIDAEYQKLEAESMRIPAPATATSTPISAPSLREATAGSGGVAQGVALHRVQSFRAFELDIYAQRDALQVAQAERQQALKVAQEEQASARTELARAQRERMKIEELQTEERKRILREEERFEEKQLEEFKPRSIFAHLQ